ncbi:hypothetical protein FKM82_008783 [Ascaphus truei]
MIFFFVFLYREWLNDSMYTLAEDCGFIEKIGISKSDCKYSALPSLLIILLTCVLTALRKSSLCDLRMAATIGTTVRRKTDIILNVD